MAMGKVYITGAGPGNPSYLTLRAYEVIQQADCILYDRLISSDMLSFAKADCELIYVGKESGHHAVPQDQIATLLYEKAKQYAIVVRLKGGDPYVFGRGGEEGVYLHDHGIAFEVIPGITSAIAGLANAGIPVTYRGIAQGFQVISAHLQKDTRTPHDYVQMVNSKQTLIFLMGSSQLKNISQNLLQAGMLEKTPAAVIAHACTPQQRTVIGTLEEIEVQIKDENITSPALIVVGNVIKFMDHLNYRSELPLHNKHILLPKIGKKPSVLGKRLYEEGANVQEHMVSEIIECPNALCDVKLEDYNYLIFTSKYSIEYFMKQLKQKRLDMRSIAHMKIAAVGRQTADYLETYGIFADIIPHTYDSEHLYQVLLTILKKDDCILFPKVKGNVSQLSQQLNKIAKVKEIEIYEHNKIINSDIFVNETYDIIVFTCSSLVHYCSDLKSSSYKYILSIGSKTTKTLQDYGFHSIVQVEHSTYEDMIQKAIAMQEDTYVL